MITLTREEAQRLIDALLAWEEECSGYGWSTNDEECVALLRAKLNEPEPEPIGYLDKNWHFWHSVHIGEVDEPDKLNLTPLYTTPPQRKWVGLTDKEITELWEAPGDSGSEFARAIEQALKEKNND